jgi:hypothetical protein
MCKLTSLSSIVCGSVVPNTENTHPGTSEVVTSNFGQLTDYSC